MRKRSATRAPKAAACCPALDRLISPQLFRALSEPNRIAILARLAGCCEPRTVGELAECCPVNISVVSRHLTLLRDAGVLEARKLGREVYYTLRTNQLAAQLRRIADCLEGCGTASIKGPPRPARPKEPTHE